MDPPIRLGIDVSSAFDPRPTGVARYIACLIEALERLDDAPEITLYSRPFRRRRGSLDRRLEGRAIEALLFGRSPRSADAFHAPDARLPRGRLQAPTVVTLHDLSALDRDDHGRPGFLAKKRKAYARAAHSSATIVTHTETVRDAIVERLGVARGRVHAVPLAAALGDPATSPRSSQERSAELLVVGGPSRRKGSHRLPKLLDLWQQELGWTPELSWVGSAPSGAIHGYADMLSPDQLARVRFLGHVDDARLDSLYRSSLGLLSLSDTEGFGIPLLEAAERGCPVLALRSSVLEEVLGPHAFWFESTAEESLPSFRQFLDPVERQLRARAAMTHAAGFSWDRSAREMLAIYRGLRAS